MDYIRILTHLVRHIRDILSSGAHSLSSYCVVHTPLRFAASGPRSSTPSTNPDGSRDDSIGPLTASSPANTADDALSSSSPSIHSEAPDPYPSPITLPHHAPSPPGHAPTSRRWLAASSINADEPVYPGHSPVFDDLPDHAYDFLLASPGACAGYVLRVDASNVQALLAPVPRGLERGIVAFFEETAALQAGPRDEVFELMVVDREGVDAFYGEGWDEGDSDGSEELDSDSQVVERGEDSEDEQPRGRSLRREM